MKRLFGLSATLPPSSLAFFCYFAWKDEVGVEGEGSFGLVEADGSWRAACREFQRCCGGRMPIPHRRPDRRTTDDGSQPGAQPEVVFKLGFKDWASRVPQLIGIPLENESSPFPELSLQRTNRGLLLWMNSDGDAYLFEDFVNGGRFIWRKEWDASQQVSAGTADAGSQPGALRTPSSTLASGNGRPGSHSSWAIRWTTSLVLFPGLSVQRTDRGLLLWTISDSDAYLFEDLVSGGRFIWRTGWDSSQRVTG